MGKRVKPGPTPAESRLETVQIADLVPHPEQETYFLVCDEQFYRALVASIRERGVETPILVLPRGNAAGLAANTIIGGHTRVRAAREVGLTTMPARVRHDLLGASRAEIDEIFLSDNATRRQLSKLGQARAAVGIYRARQAKAGRQVRGRLADQTALRDQIGKIIGMSGRNLARYLCVLETPTEAQVAFEAGHITLVQAARVATLPPGRQRELADNLRSGASPKTVITEFLPVGDGRHKNTADAVAAFARSLMVAGHDLTTRVGDVRPGIVRRFEEPLRAGVILLQQLLVKLDDAGGAAGARRMARRA